MNTLLSIVFVLAAAASAPENADLIRVLEDRAAPRAEKERVLGSFLGFEEESARSLVGFLGREPESDLRALAAFRLHGMISYLAPSSPDRDLALAFVTSPATASALRAAAVEDPAPEVRSRLIHFAASVMFPFAPESLDALAAVYVPILREAAADADAANRTEALWALTQFEGSAALAEPETRAALRARLAVEPEEDIKERLLELLENLGPGKR